jgi:hypothetical protein
MAAPDYQSIFNLENTFEPFLRTKLAAIDGITADEIFHRFSDGDMTTRPRIEVEMRVGGAKGLYKPGSGTGVENAWDVDFMVRFITDRDARDYYADLIGDVRWLFADYASLFGDDVNLPYHGVLHLASNGATHSVDTSAAQGLGEHVNELSWSGVVQIVDDAWPA